MESPQYVQPLVVACIASEVDMWSWCDSPVCYSPKAIKLLFFIMVTFSYPSIKRGCGYLLFNWFFFQSFIYISYRERIAARGGYGQIKSFEHFLCPHSEGFWPLILSQTAVLLSPERNIIWTIFLCVPRVRDLTQKLPKKLNVAVKHIPPPSHQTLVPA